MAGLELTAAADSDELSDGEAQRLKGLVDAVDLEDLSRRSPLRGRGADRFQYDVVVTDRDARHEVTASEDAAPRELRALIDWLLSQSEGQRTQTAPNA